MSHNKIHFTFQGLLSVSFAFIVARIVFKGAAIVRWTWRLKLTLSKKRIKFILISVQIACIYGKAMQKSDKRGCIELSLVVSTYLLIDLMTVLSFCLIRHNDLFNCKGFYFGLFLSFWYY